MRVTLQVLYAPPHRTTPVGLPSFPGTAEKKNTQTKQNKTKQNKRKPVTKCGRTEMAPDKGLAFVALGGGAEGDVFGDGAFSVEHREAGSTKGLLGHLPDKGDDHGGSLLALAAFRAGEPSWCLSHLEGGVVGLDFCAEGFGGGGGGDAVDDEADPSLADPGRGDWEFM